MSGSETYHTFESNIFVTIAETPDELVQQLKQWAINNYFAVVIDKNDKTQIELCYAPSNPDDASPS